MGRSRSEKHVVPTISAHRTVYARRGLRFRPCSLEEEIAAAPEWVRPLHCKDLISADAEKILAGDRFRGWFDGMMAPLTERLQRSRPRSGPSSSTSTAVHKAGRDLCLEATL
jgi:hypothetical protein